jgi:hypothetical protein
MGDLSLETLDKAFGDGWYEERTLHYGRAP